MKDSYNRNITYLRLAVTENCNLHCRYCMPQDGACPEHRSDFLTQDEIILAVEAAAELGINKLRITGGEPLVRKDILAICQRAAAVSGIREVCMTTNATLLSSFSGPLKTAGVSRLNISLDTLQADKFSYITGGGDISDALNGIHAALDTGFEKIKINTVLIGGFNDDEIASLAELTIKYPVDVRFIELMPMVDSAFGPEAYIPGNKVLDSLPELEKGERDGGVAGLYRLPDAMGNVGIITPISQHFCAECSRIRITPDGKVKPCLHSSAEYSLKGLNKEEMTSVLKEAILSKPQVHPPLSANELSESGRSMNRIGG